MINTMKCLLTLLPFILNAVLADTKDDSSAPKVPCPFASSFADDLLESAPHDFVMDDGTRKLHGQQTGDLIDLLQDRWLDADASEINAMKGQSEVTHVEEDRRILRRNKGSERGTRGGMKTANKKNRSGRRKKKNKENSPSKQKKKNNTEDGDGAGRQKKKGKNTTNKQKKTKKQKKKTSKRDKKTSKRGKESSVLISNTSTRCFSISTYDAIDADIAKLKKTIKDGVTRSHFLGGIVRLAAHDFMDFNKRDKANPMGSDGCFDESSPQNLGLPESVWCKNCLLRRLYEERYSFLSRADFWIASANAVIRQTSKKHALNLRDTFKWGRKDKSSCRRAMLPEATGCKEIENTFINRMGLDWKDGEFI